ncbi:hypothetical protein Q7A53_14105 [Halobacillus rhizosphaerae]
MEDYPVHYDGSGKIELKEAPDSHPVAEVTDEARKNIGGNPFEIK